MVGEERGWGAYEMAECATDGVQSREEIRDARRRQADGEGDDWQRVEDHGHV